MSQDNAIAVIGLSGRFPGAPDARAFWDNLREGRESVHYFTDDELRAAGETEEAISDPAYVKACARLDGIELFDAGFFGLSPRDASVFDPQHRFFLECAWEAFEHAGYVGEKVGGPVAVFAACGMSDYMIKNVMTNADVMSTVGEWLVRHTGNDTNFLATRVSYELNLRGPSMNVQTACSSSLVAVHLACQSLLSGECDMALAGGSTIYAEQNRGYFWKEGEIFSVDGHTRSFDASAAGTAMSSATGCVVLKRLEDAERDGDNVLAVILGSAVNNDGDDKVGYLAPSVSGQARVVTEALAIAGVEASEISYVEAHGTGTRIGDPIEIAGLTQAFRASTDRSQFCAIGSLKSNIGHAGEAAGVAGFIKTVLALEHKELPPSLHYRAPNPECAFPSSPFFVNDRLRPWDAARRVAGVTGLGAGGTNCHVIVEEAKPAPPSGPSRGHEVLLLSAKTPSALDAATRNLKAHLDAHPDVSLADVAFTLAQGRASFKHRRAIVGRDAADVARALETADARRVMTHAATDAPEVAFLFPGGGAQYAGMARELYDREPVFRKVADECLQIVRPMLREDLRALMFPSPGEAERASLSLERPSLALPALLTIELALARLLESWGVRPTALLGHSAGEYAAACLSGVLSLRDALALVATRGRLFETVPAGGMVSVQLSADGVRPLLGDELSIAAINAQEMCAVSGPLDALAALEAELTRREVEHQRVHIAIAAHSKMLDPILAEFGAFCRTIRFAPPELPFVSNLTGTWIEGAQATDPQYWVDHLRNTVRFEEGARTLLAGRTRVLLEVGPGRTLSSLARQQPSKPTATSTMRHPKEETSDVDVLLAAVGRAWAVGAPVDVSRLHEGQARRRLPLPTYPWERQRYWLTPGKSHAREQRSMKKRRDVGEWFHVPSWHRSVVPKPDDAGRGPWLLLTGGSSLDEAIARALRDRGDTVVVARAGAPFSAEGAHAYTFSPDRARDLEALVVALRDRGLLPRRVLHMLSLSPKSRARDLLGALARRDPLACYEADQARCFSSQAFLARALAGEVDALAWITVGEGVQRVGEGGASHPERATMLGVPKVISRELPHVRAVTVDVVVPRDGSPEHAALVAKLVREASAEAREMEVAYRDGDRFVLRYEPIALPEAREPWAADEAVTLITGGLGGIGLAVAGALARGTKRPKIALLARTPLPDETRWDALLASASEGDDLARRVRAVRELRALGATVLVVEADVTDLASMRAAASEVRRVLGPVDVVVHSAGVIDDTLLAARAPTPTSPVLDTKVKGTLALDAIFGAEAKTMLLFSSVSSILGLPGQADYTAGNAFLDAFAESRRGRPGARTVSIDWNAWQEVGMAATLVRAAHARGGRASATGHPFLEDVIERTDSVTHLATNLDRARHWLVGEHVVKGGVALVPGTGFLELARAAFALDRPDVRVVELSDVVFLSPFTVGDGEARTLHVKVARGPERATVTFFGDAEGDPCATAHARAIDADVPAIVDLDAIRAQCKDRHEAFEGFTDQAFMAFGPRWANVRRVDYGKSEALVSLRLAAAFASDLGTLALHPALLDMATGGAQKLVPGFDGARAFYVPFSYERVVVCSPIPAELFSHVRLRSSHKDTATFDVTLLDARGAIVAELSGFCMRRVAESASLGAAREAKKSRRATPVEAAMREGISPAEGVDALARVMAADVAARVVASSVDIEAWREDLERSAPREAAAGPAFERPSLSSSFEEPRTPLERDLAAIWRELLGVEKVGVRDDFFELGGQSLIAVRLFAKVKKKHGVELPLSVLFEAPTIEGCAAILARKLGRADEAEESASPARSSALHAAPAKRDHLVVIQRGGARIPFVCVHGAGGNVLNFRDLSRAMGPLQPFYGLQCAGIDGVTKPHDSIEAMAEAYLAEVRELAPRGPYLLGGYSGGGLVALEMARRITSEGGEVALLVMIDTFHPQMPIRDVTMRVRLARARGEGVDYLRSAIRRRIDERDKRRMLGEVDRLCARGEPIPPELRDVYLTRNFERVAARYRPKPWNGRAVLFRAAELPYIYGNAGRAYGWDALISHVAVEPVPGDHATLLLEPNATVLTDALGRVLADVQGLAPSPPRAHA